MCPGKSYLRSNVSDGGDGCLWVCVRVGGGGGGGILDSPYSSVSRRVSGANRNVLAQGFCHFGMHTYTMSLMALLILVLIGKLWQYSFPNRVGKCNFPTFCIPETD